MREDFGRLLVDIAEYITENKCTIRECASVFGLSKSTVHGYMHTKLKFVDAELYEEVQDILDYNFSVRHLRGGESTKKRYSKPKSNLVQNSYKNSVVAEINT